MLRAAIKRLLAPIRLAAARFAHDPSTRYQQYVGDHGCLRVAASHIAWNLIEGDYLEFGVWQGASLAEAYHAIGWNRRIVEVAMQSRREEDAFRRWWENPPRLFAFDSFEGLPPSTGANRPTDYFAGAYACSEPEVRANLRRAGVPDGTMIAIPGFFDRSLSPEVRTRLGLARAAVVMIDCDLYESTVPVLAFLTPLVAQGTILIFHDWYRFKGSRDEGEQRACREWLAANPLLELEPWWQESGQAKAFLVHDHRGA